jgi:hypothetical protein
MTAVVTGEGGASGEAGERGTLAQADLRRSFTERRPPGGLAAELEAALYELRRTAGSPANLVLVFVEPWTLTAALRSKREKEPEG